MILRQFLHTDPVVAASYVVGCGGRGVAAVIDPVGDPSLYLRTAAASGMAIRYVIDTHVHADHISSGRALAMHASAFYALHATAGAEYDFLAVHDGERLELGNVVVDVLHVPGHTPEHVALAVTDRTRADEPWLVLTGHTLMVGDMGRTELATSAEEGARALFNSAERLRRLADHVIVLPGAFSGSVCGRGLSGNPVSTIGFERRFNRAFAIGDRDAFISHMVRDIPPPPPHAAATRAHNLGVGTYADERATPSNVGRA
jgi:glyoxylase-like metal-dependent hydrolase (beta-lactamase superfamily II)